MIRTNFKTIRILFLLIVLAIVALYTCEQRRASRSWFKTLEITIYPINVENSPSVEAYIRSLKTENFAMIDRFMAREAKKYGLILSRPTKTVLGPEIRVLPPPAPKGSAGILANIVWSIKFRYWAWKNTPDNKSNLRRTRMFVLYHEARDNRRLAHSYGLNKGLLGYVNAFGAQQQQGQNNIVIAHEFLHTVGALDKYDPNGNPIYPRGYAAPDQPQLYPQKKAEIMAGRIPVSETESRMPRSLKNCVIGKETALEIHWLNPDQYRTMKQG